MNDAQIESAIDKLVEVGSNLDKLYGQRLTKTLVTLFTFSDDDYKSDYEVDKAIEALEKKVKEIADAYGWTYEINSDSDRAGIYAQVQLQVPERITPGEVAKLLGKRSEEVEDASDL